MDKIALKQKQTLIEFISSHGNVFGKFLESFSKCNILNKQNWNRGVIDFLINHISIEFLIEDWIVSSIMNEHGSFSII